VLEQESGGHRIQRVPPTERKGRVHTSTVTVAVLQRALVTAPKAKPMIKAADVVTEWFSGTGKGGQHRNKHQNSCRLKHLPTGITVTSQCRKRSQSYNEAFEELERRIESQYMNKSNNAASQTRAKMVGSGMRADKIRTYRFQDDIVKNHMNNKSTSTTKIMKGNFNLLH